MPYFQLQVVIDIIELIATVLNNVDFGPVYIQSESVLQANRNEFIDESASSAFLMG